MPAAHHRAQISQPSFEFSHWPAFAIRARGEGTHKPDRAASSIRAVQTLADRRGEAARKSTLDHPTYELTFGRPPRRTGRLLSSA